MYWICPVLHEALIALWFRYFQKKKITVLCFPCPSPYALNHMGQSSCQTLISQGKGSPCNLLWVDWRYWDAREIRILETPMRGPCTLEDRCVK